MLPSQPPENELLKTVLEPLLEDFQYWFTRSLNLLENEKITFLSEAHKADLFKRVRHALDEVNTTQMLFKATGGQVGIEMATLMPWHKLVTECWHVAMQWNNLKKLDKQIQSDQLET